MTGPALADHERRQGDHEPEPAEHAQHHVLGAVQADGLHRGRARVSPTCGGRNRRCRRRAGLRRRHVGWGRAYGRIGRRGPCGSRGHDHYKERQEDSRSDTPCPLHRSPSEGISGEGVTHRQGTSKGAEVGGVANQLGRSGATSGAGTGDGRKEGRITGADSGSDVGEAIEAVAVSEPVSALAIPEPKASEQPSAAPATRVHFTTSPASRQGQCRTAVGRPDRTGTARPR
jgi:hypothetical protein